MRSTKFRPFFSHHYLYFEFDFRVGRTARAGRKGISTVFAYGWQLPIARSIMGKKLQSFSVAANNKLFGESDKNSDSSENMHDLISSKIQGGKLWKENLSKCYLNLSRHCEEIDSN